jgi:hypothetical protein
MIYNYTPDKTVETTLDDGTQVTTTFSRLITTSTPDEYEALYVVDKNGVEQATSNGIIVLSPAQHAALDA